MGAFIVTYNLDGGAKRSGDYEKIDQYIESNFDSRKIMDNTFAIKLNKYNAEKVFELIYKPNTPIGNSKHDLLFIGYVTKRLFDSTWMLDADVNNWLEQHL